MDARGVEDQHNRDRNRGNPGPLPAVVEYGVCVRCRTPCTVSLPHHGNFWPIGLSPEAEPAPSLGGILFCLRLVEVDRLPNENYPWCSAHDHSASSEANS